MNILGTLDGAGQINLNATQSLLVYGDISGDQDINMNVLGIGSLTLAGSLDAEGGVSMVTDEGPIQISNAQIKGHDLSLLADGEVVLSQADIDVLEDVQITALDALSIVGLDITAQQTSFTGAQISQSGNVQSARGLQYKALDDALDILGTTKVLSGNVSFEAQGDVVLENLELIAGHLSGKSNAGDLELLGTLSAQNVNIDARKGDITVDAELLSSGDVHLNSARDLSLYTGTDITAEGHVTLTTEEILDLAGVSISSAQGDIALKKKSETGTASIAGNFVAETGGLEVAAYNSLDFSGALTISEDLIGRAASVSSSALSGSIGGDASLASTLYDLSMGAGSIEVTGNLNLTAARDVSLVGIDMTGDGDGIIHAGRTL